MIDGLSLEYAGTRALSRLAWRPDERLWQRLHAARGLRALLDGARNAPVGAYLSGVAAAADSEAIDAAFRAQWRARVSELAEWSPADWRPALRWTSHLVDIGPVAHLWTQPPLRWMRSDPVLARYADAPGVSTASARRALLVDGPLGPIGRALLLPPVSAARTRAPEPAPRPAVLDAWIAHWRRLWPASATTEQRAALEALLARALAHRGRFAQLPVDDSNAARETLAAHARATLRADPAQPVALFAYLLVLALDLERLRAECQMQRFDAWAQPEPQS